MNQWNTKGQIYGSDQLANAYGNQGQGGGIGSDLTKQSGMWNGGAPNAFDVGALTAYNPIGGVATWGASQVQKYNPFG